MEKERGMDVKFVNPEVLFTVLLEQISYNCEKFSAVRVLSYDHIFMMDGLIFFSSNGIDQSYFNVSVTTLLRSFLHCICTMFQLIE